MCDFFSGIIHKDGTIYIDSSDSHSIIKEKFNLIEPKEFNKNIEFYPFEVNHKTTVFQEPTKSNWVLNLSVSGGHTDGFIPKWFTSDLEEKIWNKFIEVWNERVYVNKELDSIKYKEGLFIKNCKINRLFKSKIIILQDSIIDKAYLLDIKTLNNSHILNLSSSHIDNICGDSTIDLVCGGSIIYNMCDYSKINSTEDDSIIQCMFDFSRIEELKDSSEVCFMGDKSIVKLMFDSTLIKKMIDSSKVEYVNSYKAIVIKYSNKVSVNVVHGLCIDHSGSNINVECKK